VATVSWSCEIATVYPLGFSRLSPSGLSRANKGNACFFFFSFYSWSIQQPNKYTQIEKEKVVSDGWEASRKMKKMKG
jgi:hypothetical protein